MPEHRLSKPAILAALLLSMTASAFSQDKPASDSKPAPASTPASVPVPAPAAPGSGTDWLAKANRASGVTPGTEDLAPVLFPAIAKMDKCPQAENLDTAMLLSPKSTGWDKAAAWAQAEPQKKALEALATVTDPKKKFLLGIPYGTKGVDPAWVKAGLYVELPKGDYLQGARPRYQTGIEELLKLINIEATRLADAGQCDKAMELLVRWLRLSRTLTERETALEKLWATEQMSLACERICDLAHEFREKMTPEILSNTAIDLDERLINAGRMRLPEVNRMAALQLIDKTIQPKGAVDLSKFSTTLARLRSQDHPLTLFSSAAFFREMGANHAGWFDTLEQLKKVYDGWQTRWDTTDLHDRILKINTDYARMDKAKFALIDMCVAEVDKMEGVRILLLTNLAGTRTALGVVGYQRKEKQWPPSINAIAPLYVKKLDVDPCNYDARFKVLQPFRYFVPMRDQVLAKNQDPSPYEITVTTGLQGDDAVAAVSAAVDAAKKSTGDSSEDLSASLAEIEPFFKLLRFGGYMGAKKHNATRAVLTDKGALAAFMSDECKLVYSQLKDHELGMAFMKAFVDLGNQGSITPDSFKTSMLGYIEAQQMTDDLQKKWGISLAPVKAALSSAAKKLAESETFKNALQKKRADGMIDLDVLGSLFDQFATVFASTTVVGPIAEQFVKLYTGPQGEVVLALATAWQTVGGSFNVSLTDKDFVLYSVGPDGSDGLARSVGTGGDDLLIWPPIITLRRQHMNQP